MSRREKRSGSKTVVGAVRKAADAAPAASKPRSASKALVAGKSLAKPAVKPASKAAGMTAGKTKPTVTSKAVAKAAKSPAAATKPRGSRGAKANVTAASGTSRAVEGKARALSRGEPTAAPEPIRSGEAAPVSVLKRAGKRQAPARARSATMRKAKFGVGQVVRHKFYPFRGIVFDIDPVFASTEEWWLSIPPEMRPKKNQPFYHLLAENDETEYIAYVSEQNLTADHSGSPIRHPQLAEFFIDNGDGTYRAVFLNRH